MEKKRFAVLLCAEDSEYVKTTYGGYFKLFVALLMEEGETWDLYRVSAGEFPADDDIPLYQGFVITGSCNDAHGDDDWICRLLRLLRRLHSLNKMLLGVCIHPLQQHSMLSSLRIPSHLPVIECHRDEVWELPPLAEVIARSDRTGVEMFRYGEHIMGIQGHPEYTKDILLNLIDRLLQRNLIQVTHTCLSRRSSKGELGCEGAGSGSMDEAVQELSQGEAGTVLAMQDQ